MASVATIQSEACSSGIGKLSSLVGLLQVAAQLNNTRASPEPPPSSTLLNGLTAYWNMNEASGDSFDSVSAVFSLVDVGGVGSGSGVGEGPNLSRSFNGTTQYLLAANNAIYTSNPLTINIWAKLNDPSSFDMILAKDDFEAAQRDYDILTTPSPGATFQQYKFNDFEGSVLNEVTVDLADGLWHMITLYFGSSEVSVTFDATDGPYINPYGPPPWDFRPGSNSLSVGARYRDSSGNFDSPVEGDLALLGMWNRALTADEILELYNGGVGLLYSEL